MRIRTLKTAADIVEALAPTDREFGRRYGLTKQLLNYYLQKNVLPPRIYLRCIQDLRKIRCTAPPELWGIDDPKASRAA